jgi:hypothetical protein
MPLVSSILQQGLKTIFTPATMPKDIAAAASDWATAVDNYASSVVPPSTTAAAAKSAFQSIMMGVDPNTQNGIPLLIAAFTAYATQLGLGMAPTFTGTPPPLPLNIVPVTILGLNGGSADDCAALFATITDAWFRTGLAINNSSGVTIPWS